MKKIIFIIIFIALTVFAVFAFSSSLQAQTVEEIKAQISNTNSQIEQLNKEIKELSGQIAETAEQKNTLANAIKDLILTRNKLLKEKTANEKKIQATGLVIQTLDNQIGEKLSTLDKSKAALAISIKSLNQQDGETFLERILSQSSLSEFSREYADMVSLNTEIRNNMDYVNLQKEDLTQTKSQKEEEKQALTDLKQTLTAKQLEIEANKKEKDTLLIQTKNKESEYQKMLADTQKRKDSFEKAIEDYEAQIQFILNPKSIPKAGSSPLTFPLNSIIVTSPYGARWGSFHYGLDLRAAVGTSVKAMATGVVEGTGNTDIDCKGASFGNWVFIRYNNGLSSTYGHLSSIIAKVGQKVKAGDVIGLSGGAKGVFGSGSSTGPHLHTAVYASAGVKVDTVPSKSCNGKIFTQPIAALTAYLNPALYLPPITASMVKK